MISKKHHTLGALLALAILGPALSGCGYTRDRVNDLGQVVDLGVSVSRDPYFSAYVLFPPVQLTPLGWGEVDGRFLGLGGGRGRFFSPYYQYSYGWVLYGRETLSFEYNKQDLEPLSEDELRDMATFYRCGPVGLGMGPVTKYDYVISCPHYLHLGWAGIVLTPRYCEMFDFFLGFTTLDIAGDDGPDGPSFSSSDGPSAIHHEGARKYPR